MKKNINKDSTVNGREQRNEQPRDIGNSGHTQYEDKQKPNTTLKKAGAMNVTGNIKDNTTFDSMVGLR